MPVISAVVAAGVRFKSDSGIKPRLAASYPLRFFPSLLGFPIRNIAFARFGASPGLSCWFARWPYGFAGSFSKFGEDMVIRLAQQLCEFLVRQGVFRFQCDPFCASQIRRGDDAGAFRQFREIFRRAFEREPDRCRLQHGHGKNLFSHSKGQIVTPRNFFRGARKRETELAHLIDGHNSVASDEDFLNRVSWR